jgi:hypothetical protein
LINREDLIMREEDILKDPQASAWLRDALRAALSCDPVRVANDAACLYQLLARRAASADPAPGTDTPRR